LIARSLHDLKNLIMKFRFLLRGIVWSFQDYFYTLSARRASSIVIFPQLGLGDQMILMGAFLDLSKTKKVTVLVNESGFRFLSVVLAGTRIELQLIPKRWLTAPDWSRARHYAHQIAKSKNAKLFFLGSDLVGWMCRFRPDLSPTENCYRLLDVSPEKYVSKEVLELLQSVDIPQLKLTSQPYAIVDTFPGEPRDIPQYFLRDIENRGLKVIHNPRDISYLQIFSLITNATEIHVTNSSLLCLSLLLPTRAKLKRVYLIHGNVFNGHRLYDLSWKEVPIRENSGADITSFQEVDRESHLEFAISKSKKFDKRLIELFFRHLSGGDLGRPIISYPDKFIRS
jgi:hypothetical protein